EETRYPSFFSFSAMPWFRLLSSSTISILFMGYPLLKCPVFFLKSHKDPVPVYEKGPLYQHAVTGQKTDLFLLAHIRKPILKSQLLVLHAACVEKFFHWQATHPDPLCQFLLRGIFLHNVPVLERDPSVLQIFLCPLAGAAFWIFNKKHDVLSPFVVLCVTSAWTDRSPPAHPRSHPLPEGWR